jgi:lipid-binding SYLF domain-containing protein
MKTFATAAVALAAFVALSLPAPAFAKKAGKLDAERAKIDAEAQGVLDRLFKESPGAKSLYDKAAGWAAFRNMKVAIGITGGGGHGVAVDKSSGQRTYMKMGTGGVNVGLGAQKYEIVFLFETQAALDRFETQGWQADTSASAAAGKEGANAEATFRDGVAYYQMTDKGLMLSADLTGTKYWKNDKLSP